MRFFHNTPNFATFFVFPLVPTVVGLDFAMVNLFVSVRLFQRLESNVPGQHEMVYTRLDLRTHEKAWEGVTK